MAESSQSAVLRACNRDSHYAACGRTRTACVAYCPICIAGGGARDAANPFCPRKTKVRPIDRKYVAWLTDYPPYDNATKTAKVYYTCRDTGTQIVDGSRGGYDVVYNGVHILNLPSLGPGAYMVSNALDTVEDAMFEVARVRHLWTILPVEGVGYGLTSHGSCQLTAFITDGVVQGVRDFVCDNYGRECYESKVFPVKTTSVHNETANLVVYQTSRTTYQLELQISGYTYLFVPRLAVV